jgi:U3 small nucleolar RNA-associated protein 11
MSPDEKLKKKKKKKKVPTNEGVSELATTTQSEDPKEHRSRLLKELAARLVRDTQLRYAAREFEMQRLLMGKGARRKLKGIEKVEGDTQDSEEDQDELDARGGRPSKSGRKALDEATWKPRVYKWKLERKK